MHNLPPILAQVADVAGLPAAMALAKARGGREVTIPANAPGTVLAEIVGVEAAEKIIKSFGYGDIAIPFGPFGGARARRIAIVSTVESGATVSQAAVKADVSTRTVKRVKAKMRKANQPDLFD